MARQNILVFIKRLNRPMWTTHELTAISGRSASSIAQALSYLEKQGLVFKICRGIWGEAGNERLSAYNVIPFLSPRQRLYVSFISALHLYGIIEQIPQVITLASTTHTKTIHTKLGTFCVHQMAASFFKGFDWHKGTGGFLIAEPEKALIDSLYLSACKKKQFGYFPELNFPRSFNFKRARDWAKSIPNVKIRLNVLKKLKTFYIS